ncbi:hypothetical protein Tco_1164262 [Tanacetum coccineum]
MAALMYKDDHNKIAYLGRERGCEDFTDILSYLDHSPLRYVLTHDPPVVFDSLVKQFWATAVVRPNAAGSHDLVATIDGREVVVTESLIRTQLQFDDANGIFDMPIPDVLEGMRVIGYPTDGTLTFLKNHLSPQWRFLVHTIMHCLSPKSGSWNQFPSSIATALICLSTGRDNAAANEAAGSAAEAHLVPHSPPVSPVREPLPLTQRGSCIKRTTSPSPTIPETKWFGSTPEPESHLPASPELYFEEPLVFGHEPRPARMTPTLWWHSCGVTCLADDAPTPTADAAGRAEDPALLTVYLQSLTGVWDKLEKTVKQLRETRLVVDASAAEGDMDIQDDIDLDGLSRMASTALGHDQPAVPSEDVEEREEEEVPLRLFPELLVLLLLLIRAKGYYDDLDIPLSFFAEDAHAGNAFEKYRLSIFSSCYLFRKSFSSTIMGDANPIRTLGDYSKPSHEGYRNTVELPEGNNVPILDINYFRHFLDILQNYDPMDDEPMWVADRVVAPTPGSAITIPEITNEFAIKETPRMKLSEMLRNCHGHNLSKGNIIKIFYHGLNEITQEVLNAAASGNSNFDIDKIMARMDAMTMKMEAQYKDFQSRSKQSNLDDDDIRMPREKEAKFMQTFCHTRFYNDYRDRDSNRDNWRSSGRNDYN